MTFDVLSIVPTITQFSWQRFYEAFSVCRNCRRPTIFSIAQDDTKLDAYLSQHSPIDINGSLNEHFRVDGFICLKDMGAEQPPDHVPDPIANAFREGAVSSLNG
jgi:hypothetical protein